MNTTKKTKSTGDKEKKPKLVRDSFTIPKDEYAAIDAVKARALGLSQAVKKSEILRAGLMALSGMNDAQLLATLQAVPTLKTGRPPCQEGAPQSSAPVEPVAAAAAPAARRRTSTAARKTPAAAAV